MIDFPASPTTGQIFSAAGASWRYDGTKWVAYGSGSGNAGRNLIHNPLFNIAQRGSGPWTTNGAFTLDRWLLSLVLDTASISQSAHSDTSRAQVGDEAAAFLLGNTFTGNAGASAFNRIMQRVEDVRRLGGKTVTVSFWAAAGAGTPKLGIGIIQNFGTGGSPSAAVVVNGQSVTISTVYTRYSVTFAVPSVSGKTLGTASDHNTELSFWYSCGATNAVAAGGPGVQSGTVALWGVQLEIGSAATPLEKPDPADDLARCQRFYQSLALFGATYGPAGSSAFFNVFLPVSMRATPTNTLVGVTYSNASAAGGTSVSPSQVSVSFTVTSAGVGYVASGTLTASADL